MNRNVTSQHLIVLLLTFIILVSWTFCCLLVNKGGHQIPTASCPCRLEVSLLFDFMAGDSPLELFVCLSPVKIDPAL